MNAGQTPADIFRKRMRIAWLGVAAGAIMFFGGGALLSPLTRDWAHRGLWHTLGWLLVVAAAGAFLLFPLQRRCPACGSNNLGERSDGDGAIDFSPASCNACGAQLRL